MFVFASTQAWCVCLIREFGFAGGFGIYGAWRWRQLRKIENEVVQYQRELLKSLQQQETTAASQVTKNTSRLAPQQRKPEPPQGSSIPIQGVTEKPPLKA